MHHYKLGVDYPHIKDRKTMPTIEQIRAARALLGWNQHELADKAGLSQTGIARIENGTNQPNSKTLEKIGTAFDHADIEFIGDTGLRKRSIQSQTYRGIEGFKEFLDNVYHTARDVGGELCTFNAATPYFKTMLGAEWYEQHAERMQAIRDNFTMRLIVEEGTKDLLAKGFGEYKFFPKNLLTDQKIYVYGDFVSFMNFANENVEIVEVKHGPSAESFRILFNIAWEKVATSLKE